MKFKDLEIGEVFEYKDPVYNRICRFLKTEDIFVRDSDLTCNCIWLNHYPGKAATMFDDEEVTKICPKYFDKEIE